LTDIQDQVELCQRGDRSIGQVAKDFDLTETAVRQWIAQAGRGIHTDGLSTDERDELARLWENRRLSEDVEILNERRLSSRRRSGERVPVIEAENAGMEFSNQSISKPFAYGSPIWW
jgi:transposase-like protein